MSRFRRRGAVPWPLIAAAVPLGVFLLTVGWWSIPRTHEQIDLIAGRDTFRAHCGGCHFAMEGFPAHHGPNLYDIGTKAASRKPNFTAAQYILESILEPQEFIAPSSRPGMPRNLAARLSPAEIRNVVAFLVSLGAFPDYDEILALDIPDLRRGDREQLPVGREHMELAESVMRGKGKCFECHAMHSHPEYKVFAPGLFGTGLIDPKGIQTSLVDPHEVVSPTYQTVNVILKRGTVLTGRMISRTDDQIVLVAWDGEGTLQRLEIPLEEVDEEDGELLIEPSTSSPMPTGFDQSLTPEEQEAVITLIRQLN